MKESIVGGLLDSIGSWGFGSKVEWLFRWHREPEASAYSWVDATKLVGIDGDAAGVLPCWAEAFG